MSKKRQRIDPSQVSIFELLARKPEERSTNEGSMSVVDELKIAINEAIKGCPLSRHQIAGELSHLLNEEISKAQIDSWTAESKERHIPGEYLPAFCAVTGDIHPLEVLIRKAGLFCLQGPDALRSEIQALNERESRLRKRKRQALLLLESIEGCDGRPDGNDQTDSGGSRRYTTGR